MKYVVISDLHCKLRGFDKIVDGVPELIYFPLLNLRKAKDLAKKENADLLILGDLIHEKRNINQVVLDEVIKALVECTNEVNTIIVMGNHDYINDFGKKYSWLNNLILNNAQIVKPGEPLIDGNCAFVAHNDKESLSEDLSNCNLGEDTNILFSHFGLQEAKLSSTDYQTGEFSATAFSQLSLVILGHYHKPQKVKENCYYVGSSIPTNISEYDEEKRMLIVDTDTLEVQSIPTVYPKTVKLDLNKTKIDLKKIPEKVEDELSKFVITVEKGSEQIPELIKLKNKFPGYISLKIEEKEDKVQSENQISDIDALSFELILDKLLEKNDVPEIARSKYKAIGLKIFDETLKGA